MTRFRIAWARVVRLVLTARIVVDPMHRPDHGWEVRVGMVPVMVEYCQLVYFRFGGRLFRFMLG